MVTLNWHERSIHWSGYRAPCLYCTRSTVLRDELRRPAHKVCAEAAIERALKTAKAS